ncbi:MAG: type IV secretory system conjugative DNA transfer family protein [Bacteroidetes bacterium]|nr:type IV secretory system conjugative DNA transfer family protein [Bacteroidota bacterium]
MEIITNIFTTIFAILEGIFKFFSEAVEAIFSNNSKEYKADFASAGILLSRFNYGYCLTGGRSLSRKDSYQNALIVGGTGTGKSSVVLIPSLFKMRGSFVIHDPSGELYAKSAGYLEQKGYQIKVLNFTNPDKSSVYNPLQRIQTTSDVQKVSSILVDTALGGKAKDPFWNIQAISLLSMLISVLKKQGSEYQNLYNVRQLLNRLGGEPQSVDALFSEYADDILFAEYKSFLSYDDKVISGITATCKASLQLFSDDAVARVTSFDNLDFLSFRDTPTALYIQNSVADQKYYSVLTSIFFEQFFSFLLGRFPEKTEQDIFLLIDEASSLNLPTLPLAVANVRKHRSGIMLLVQDFNQLVHNYGKYEADGIKANCFAKMYFTGQSLETSTDLERTLGKYEYKDKEGHKVVRSLMTSNEVRMMDIKRALLICGHHPPIKARLRPYYKYIKFRQYGNMPMPENGDDELLENVKVLPMNIIKKNNE